MILIKKNSMNDQFITNNKNFNNRSYTGTCTSGLNVHMLSNNKYNKLKKDNNKEKVSIIIKQYKLEYKNI